MATETKKLQAQFTITDGTNQLKYDYEFKLTQGMSYGNGYYIWIECVTQGCYSSQGIDLRYNRHFTPTYFLAYATKWACENWSGKNGSYRLIGIDLKEIEG